MSNIAALIFRQVRTSPAVIVSALLFVCMYIILVILSPSQFTPFSINNFLVLITTLCIAAAGTTLVLITGGFDLSVAGTISLANVLAATLMTKYPDHVWTIALIIIVVGLVVGLINGFLVAVLGLQSIAVTLSSYIVLTGGALMVLPAPGGKIPDSFVMALTTQVGPVAPALVILLAVVILWLVFARTRTGIASLAIGADIAAARMSGIPVRRVLITCYGLAGALYACSGLYLSAATASGDPNSGQPFMLAAFAAMALGLVSFKGGSGSVIATIFGAATLMVIPKMLFATGISDFWTGAFKGAVILIALSLPKLGQMVGKYRSRYSPSAEAENTTETIESLDTLRAR